MYRMRKKVLIVTLVIITISIGVYLFLIFNHQPVLEKTVIFKEEYNDYIIHIRIEAVNKEQFQVLRSLEYIGQEKLSIKHRTPLIAITMDKDNPVFTGSHRNRLLLPGYHYHPQDPLVYDNLTEGKHIIYVHTQFDDGEEIVNIKTKGEVYFE